VANLILFLNFHLHHLISIQSTRFFFQIFDIDNDQILSTNDLNFFVKGINSELGIPMKNRSIVSTGILDSTYANGISLNEFFNQETKRFLFKD
jgi:hypothetical protein